jgi:hypothetical protein
MGVLNMNTFKGAYVEDGLIVGTGTEKMTQSAQRGLVYNSGAMAYMNLPLIPNLVKNYKQNTGNIYYTLKVSAYKVALDFVTQAYDTVYSTQGTFQVFVTVEGTESQIGFFNHKPFFGGTSENGGTTYQWPYVLNLNSDSISKDIGIRVLFTGTYNFNPQGVTFGIHPQFCAFWKMLGAQDGA